MSVMMGRFTDHKYPIINNIMRAHEFITEKKSRKKHQHFGIGGIDSEWDDFDTSNLSPTNISVDSTGGYEFDIPLDPDSREFKDRRNEKARKRREEHKERKEREERYERNYIKRLLQ